MTDPVIPVLGIQKKSVHISIKQSCTRMLTATLFIVVPNWNNLYTCPPRMDKQIVYSHDEILYSNGNEE